MGLIAHFSPALPAAAEAPETGPQAPAAASAVTAACATVDNYLLYPDDMLNERIAAARARLGERVIVLGHHYQRDEVVRFADCRGDSLQLARQAAASRAQTIVFCGVHFMAESADILRQPHQRVILPDLQAGCSMADMAEIEQVEIAWEQLERLHLAEEVAPITYINSSAAIKAFCGRRGGLVCTSSNAARALRWAWQRKPRVLFLPDQHLGRNTAHALGVELDRMAVWDPRQDFGGNAWDHLRQSQILLWKGHCSVHARFRPEHVDEVRRRHPGTRVVVHPECPLEVVQKADLAGSTEFIIRQIETAPAGSQWAIGTEVHLVNRLAHEHPRLAIHHLDSAGCPWCSTMYRISPQHLCWVFEELVAGRVVNPVEVASPDREAARMALDRMLEV